MSVRRNCGHSNDGRSKVVRKVHRLKEADKNTEQDLMMGRTLCNLKGILITVHIPDGEVRMVIRSPADHRYPVTNANLEVTCARCARALIGEPLKTKSKPRLFRSTHLRRAVMPLGLLRG